MIYQVCVQIPYRRTQLEVITTTQTSNLDPIQMHPESLEGRVTYYKEWLLPLYGICSVVNIFDNLHALFNSVLFIRGKKNNYLPLWCY